MSKHHAEGMSRWTAFAECPYYAAKTGAANVNTEVSNFGTRAHAYLEALVKGSALPAATSDEREVAEWAYEWVRDYAAGAEIHSETRVEIRDDAECGGIFGTCDLWWLTPDRRLVVADFKSIGLVEKDHTPQLMGYAWALASADPELCDEVAPVTGIILHGGSHYAEIHEFYLSDAVKRGREIIAAHRSAKEGDARTCGSCQYCGHYPCAAVTNQLAVIRTPWTALNLAQKMLVVKEVERIKDNVEAEVRKVLEAGGTVYDPATKARFELVTRKGSSPLRDIEGLAQKMIGGFGVDREKFLSLIKVTKTALIAEILERGAAVGKLYTKKEASAMLDPYFGEPGEMKVLKRTDLLKGKKGNK